MIKEGDTIKHYKHYPEKGEWHIYVVNAIAKPLPKRPISSVISRASHSEDLSNVAIAFIAGGHYFGPCPIDSFEDHVIYSSTALGQSWARPISHFTEPMEDGRMRFEINHS